MCDEDQGLHIPPPSKATVQEWVRQHVEIMNKLGLKKSASNKKGEVQYVVR